MIELYQPSEQIVIAYWKGMLGKPIDQGAGTDPDGKRHDVSTDPVYLACNVRGGAPVVRKIGPISSDKSIFVPVNPVVISEPEANSSDVAVLRKHATEDEDSASEATLTIDGEVHDVKKQQFRFPTKDFEVNIPDPAGTYKAVADGYYVMIKPLPVGPHTIKFQGKVGKPFSEVPPWEQDVTYNFEVR